jgi:sugar/nucleoside kinase (ribokinase family)
MTTPPNKTLNASASDGSPGGGESTATWKPSRLVSYPDGRRFTLLGGAALHVALAASRAGLAAAPISVIGNDLEPMLDDRRLATLDLASVNVVPGRSCTFRLSYDGDGQLAEAECDFGAAAKLTDHALSVLGRYDRYHVCCRRPLDVALILNRLVINAVSFSADFYLPSAVDLIPAAAALLPSASTVFVNAAEFAVLADAMDLARLPSVLISDGPRPVTLMQCGQIVAALRPPSSTVTEVTGAGDTLVGTFLAATAQGLADVDALQAAVSAATRVIRDSGISVTGI